MIFDNATDIQVVVQVTQRLILEKFMGRVSHGISRITSLSPTEWEADTPLSSDALYVCQRDTINYNTFS